MKQFVTDSKSSALYLKRIQRNYLFKLPQQLLKTKVQANHLVWLLSFAQGQNCPYIQLQLPTMRNCSALVWVKLDRLKRHLGIQQILAILTHVCLRLCCLLLHAFVWFSWFNTMLV